MLDAGGNVADVITYHLYAGYGQVTIPVGTPVFQTSLNRELRLNTTGKY
jgi:hypothetical protein